MAVRLPCLPCGSLNHAVWQEVTQEVEVAEIAFTGDTSGEFMTCPGSEDVFRARLLIMELTYLDDEVGIERARVSPRAASWSD